MGQLLSLKIAHAVRSFNTAGRFIEVNGHNPFPYLKDGPFLVLQCNSTKCQVSVVFSSSGRPKMKTVDSVLGCIFSSRIVAIRRLQLSQHSGTFMITYDDPYKRKMLVLNISIKKGESTTAGK